MAEPSTAIPAAARPIVTAKKDAKGTAIIPASSRRPFTPGLRQRGQMRANSADPYLPQHLDQNLEQGGTLGDDCYDRMATNLALLPAVLSSSRNITMPMTAVQAADQFGEVVVFTNLDVQSQGLVSKLVQGGSVPTPYLIRGLCIVARIVPYRYATTGAALDKDAGPCHIPEVVTPLSVPEDETAVQASFDYNSAGIIAYDLFLRTYQFQYVLQGRYIFVNERAIDIGVTDSMTQPQGFGSGKYDPSQDINTANNTFRVAADVMFGTPNCTVATADGVAIPAPLVDIQWVQPTAPGVYGCCYPIRPHILWPMQTYQFYFQRTSQTNSEHDRLIAETTVASFTKPSDGWTDTLGAGVNGPSIFTGTLPLRFAQLELGIMFRGGEFVPVDALEWLMRWGFPFANMWLQQPMTIAGLNGIATQYGLAGIPRPLPPQARVEVKDFGVISGMLGDPESMGGVGDDLHKRIPDRRKRFEKLLEASREFYGAENAYLRAVLAGGKTPP